MNVGPAVILVSLCLLVIFFKLYLHVSPDSVWDFHVHRWKDLLNGDLLFLLIISSVSFSVFRFHQRYLKTLFLKKNYFHPCMSSSSFVRCPFSQPFLWLRCTVFILNPRSAPGPAGAPAPEGGNQPPPNLTSNRRLQQTQAQVDEVRETYCTHTFHCTLEAEHFTVGL